MHNETVIKLSNAAKNKFNLLSKSKFKYLVSSAFAGLYVGQIGRASCSERV